MKEPHKERSSEPLWPRVLRCTPRGVQRSVDSGTSGRGYRASKSSFRTPTLLADGEGNTGYSANRELYTGIGVVKEPRHIGKLSAREPGGLCRV
jgi:hypothetical protein